MNSQSTAHNTKEQQLVVIEKLTQRILTEEVENYVIREMVSHLPLTMQESLLEHVREATRGIVDFSWQDMVSNVPVLEQLIDLRRRFIQSKVA